MRKRRHQQPWWRRVLNWVPTVAMLVYTIVLALNRNFIPEDIRIINVYLLLMGLYVVPKMLFALCSAAGLVWKRLVHIRYNWGNIAAIFLILFCWYSIIYGSTLGFRKLDVRHIDLYFDDLPASFEGYKIVQFSDAHVGSFSKNGIRLLQNALDSINAQQPDLIVFTGDLQNLRPKELDPVQQQLAGLRAKDGVVSVLGNHDYSEYIHENPAIEAANCREIISRERQCGWQLLLNEHKTIYRGGDSIVIAGEENLEKPARADFSKTMDKVDEGAFVVMLQHNPEAWEQHIKPSNRVQLTLSGHMHGGQVALMGFRPSALKYKHDYGLFKEDNKALYVASSVGALIPFRIGISGEIAVITLHKAKS
ncbi:MAG: metallophosphoesterase [Prevotella sp.]